MLKKIINHLNKNQLSEALSLCEKNKDNKIQHTIYNIKGVILFKQNKFEQARINFLKSIELEKKFIDPYKNLFQLFLKTNDLTSAIKTGNKVIALDINKNSLSYFNLALAYDLNRDFKKAIQFYNVAENLNFKEKKILFNNIAKCFFGLNNIEEAKRYYLKALKINENDKLTINNLLILYLRIGDKDQAEYFYNKAKEIDHNYIEFKLNESDYLFFKNEIEKAIEILNSIVTNSKNYIAYTKLAKIYSIINNNKKAIETIEEAISVYPNMSNLKLTRGVHHLIEGNFEIGWEFYELRDTKVKDDTFENIKDWQGQNLKDTEILVTCEQGMGDVLQFSKFLMNLSPFCKKIDFLLYDKLLPVFKKKEKNINICKKSEVLKNNYDYKVSLGSLNKYFFKEKNFNTSSLINFSDEKKNKWSLILDKEKKNIGLIWSGNFFGPKEPFRSIELKNFENLLKLDVNFYSFQNEIWERDKEFFKTTNIIDYSNKSFTDIIAIIQNLDLVISSDTFFLHLACICNKETWGLFSLNADWRWYEYYKYNPYKSLKIYKQSNYKNWDNVLRKVQSDLKEKFHI